MECSIGEEWSQIFEWQTFLLHLFFFCFCFCFFFCFLFLLLLESFSYYEKVSNTCNNEKVSRYYWKVSRNNETLFIILICLTLIGFRTFVIYDENISFFFFYFICLIAHVLIKALPFVSPGPRVSSCRYELASVHNI